MRLSHPSPSPFWFSSSFCLPYTHAACTQHLASTGDKETLPRISCKSHFIHSPGCLVGCWAEASPWEGRGEEGHWLWRVEGTPLVPLHVPRCGARTAPGMGAQNTAVLVIALLSRYAATASGVLVADPPAGPEVGGRARGETGDADGERWGMAQPLGRVGLPIIPHYLGVEQSTTTLPRSTSAFFLPLTQSCYLQKQLFFKIFFFF